MRKLKIAKSEINYLNDLLSKNKGRDEVHAKCFNKLRTELQLAEVIDDEDLPSSVIRMNSFIDIGTPMGEKKAYQLVIPEEGNFQSKKISILSPIGTALIGYEEGDTVTWIFPNGEKEIKILKVYTKD